MARTLFSLAGDGRLDAVEALLQAGTPVDQSGTLDVTDGSGAVVTVSGVTPLMRAAAEGHEAVVRALLAAGADPAARASDRWTPLMMAVIGESPACVTALVAAGAPLEDRNDRGETALWLALEGEDLAVARVLAEAGADLDATDEDGVTALMAVVDQPLAISRQDAPVATVRWLLARGADMTPRAVDGRSALDRAIQAGQDECVQILLGIG